jgi:8-oxo-dGTP diphosphatase
MSERVPRRVAGPEADASTRERPACDDPGLRIGAKALVTAGNRVLLVEERHGDGSSFWTLPGGGAEHGESLPEALRRECYEELRCRCTVGAPLAACVYRHRTDPRLTAYTVFEATLRDTPEPNAAEGILDYAWRRPDALADRTLGPFQELITDVCGPDIPGE